MFVYRSHAGSCDCNVPYPIVLHSQTFEVKHDQAMHDYSVEFSPQSSLLAVRIDPCSGPGDVKILKMHLSTNSGRLLHTLTF